MATVPQWRHTVETSTDLHGRVSIAYNQTIPIPNVGNHLPATEVNSLCEEFKSHGWIDDSVEEIARKLPETLERIRQFAVSEDWHWAHEEAGQNAMNRWDGDYVAVVNKTVVGASNEDVGFREEVAGRCNVPVERVVVVYRGPSWRCV